MKDAKLKDAIKIVAKFIILLFNNDDQKKTIEFLKNSIDKEKRISPLVYTELMINCQDDKYELMQDYIYKTLRQISKEILSEQQRKICWIFFQMEK